MGKEEIFSKLNIKDYSNELEKIIEKKAFSEDTKNLLLSMFYKIENSYEDYKKTKSIEKTKKEKLEEILILIEKECKIISIIKPKIDEDILLKNEKGTTIKKEKKIIAYPNEKSIYHFLCKLKKEKFLVSTDLNIINNAIENLMNEGSYINDEEIIRDFDGWSWNIEQMNINNLVYNLVYQNMLMILGEDKLIKWIHDEKYFEEIINTIGKKSYIIISKIALLEYAKDDSKKIQEINNKIAENNIKILEISDKKKYLENIAKAKRKIEKKIKEIDNLITNIRTLKEAFIKANENLDETTQIFSLSDFVEIKQNERISYIKQLKEYSEAMKPSFFVERKEKILETFEILSIIDKPEQKENLIIELQKEIIKIFTKKINKIETKKEIYDMIYKLRYYKEIFIDKNTQIKDKKELERTIKNAEKKLFTIACNFKVLNILTINIEENYKMISEILNTRMIDLEDIVIEFSNKTEKIVLNIYEDRVIERFIEYDKIEGLNVKLNKKIKLFI